jgi:putative DNA primase/helicase
LSIHIRGKWIVCGNHLPAISDHSVGFWRRWDIVPFGSTVPTRERDPHLAKRVIEKELSGVLLWALQGLIRLLARGGFDANLPQAMEEALHDAKADTNSVVAWVDDCEITVGGTCAVSKSAVFEQYRWWCSDNALQTLGSTQFWKRLRELQRDLLCERHRVAGSQQYLCNVKLLLRKSPVRYVGHSA